MRSFKKFWTAYGAAERLENGTQNQETKHDASVLKQTLKDWFSQNFPRNMLDVFYASVSELQDFFENLKRYPELAKDNWDDLGELLARLKSGNYEMQQIPNLPTLDDFKS